MTNQLPPELKAIGNLVDAQASPIQQAFQYCLCLMMVEQGKMTLVETLSGDMATCVFESSEGDRFSVVRPTMSKEDEVALIKALKAIMEEDESS